MEKYATYKIYLNEDTNEVKRVPFDKETDLIKLASFWKEVANEEELERLQCKEKSKKV